MVNMKIKVAFFSGPTDSSVCLADALCEYCKVDFFYGVRYAINRDISMLDLLNSEIKKIPINSYRIRDVRNLWSYYRIAKELKNYDVIHIQSGSIWFSLWRCCFKKVPIVCTVHDPYQHMGLRKSNRYYQDIAQNWIVSQSSKFIVHGQRMKKALFERYNLSLDDISVIPHGEYSFYKSFKPRIRILRDDNKKFKRILFFGTIRRNKGLEYLIKAEPIISKKYNNYKMCIAGKFQEDFDYYNKLIRNKNKFEIIDDYVPNNQVADLFENSDIVILPYISATQSGVLAIAFGFGKPVIATNTGSLGEYLSHGKTGLLVEPQNERALANAIVKLISDDDLLKEMGKNALQYCEKNLSWDSIAKKTMKIYSDLIKK